MSESQPSKASSPRTISETDKALPFIMFSIRHSHQLLVLFLSMSDLTTCVHPAYENLLCSFAMVTLAEFVSHVTNIEEVSGLMERAISHIQRGGKAEPVSRWSLNVIKQHVTGNSELENFAAEGPQSAETFVPLMTDPAAKSWIDSEWNVEQEFPSLEEMFFGNVV